MLIKNADIRQAYLGWKDHDTLLFVEAVVVRGTVEVKMDCKEELTTVEEAVTTILSLVKSEVV